MFRQLVTASAIGLAPAVAFASDVTLVVERGPTTVEIFLGMPAEGLVDYFGLPPERLEDETGAVAFEPLRLGTWTIGDDVFAGVTATIDGAPIVYEAMSLMVHPEDQKLPLYDGWDGLMAIAVCSVEPPENPTLETLYSYVGYIAYPDDPTASMSFTLPQTGRDALNFEIRDFRQGKLISEQKITVADGGVITLDAVPQSIWTNQLLWYFALGGLVACAAIGFGLRSSARFRRAEPTT